MKAQKLSRINYCLEFQLTHRNVYMRSYSFSLHLVRSVAVYLSGILLNLVSSVFATLIPIRPAERNLNLNHQVIFSCVRFFSLLSTLFGQVDLLIKSLASISNLIAWPFLPGSGHSTHTHTDFMHCVFAPFTLTQTQLCINQFLTACSVCVCV